MTGPDAQGRRIAVLVGVGSYEGGLPPLEFADDDARELHALLTNPRYGQFDPTASALLLDPAKRELEEHLETTIRTLAPQDTFLLYFAGHALRYGEHLFLAPRDAAPQRPLSSCVSLGLLDAMLDASACRGQIMLLDCCFAGAPGGPRTRALVTQSLQHLSGQGRMVIGSSGHEETSRETSSLGHGVFTAGLLDGLRSGDADHDADGFVSVHDMFQHVYNFVVQRAPQEPVMWGADIRGDMYLSLNPRVRFRQVKHPVDGKPMSLVDGGTFLSGPDNEVRAADAYYMDVTPVTNAEYARFTAATGHPAPRHWEGPQPPAALADHPVVHVTHTDATAYASWAGKRLPESEEWEKAARGSSGSIYPWGNQPTVAKCNVRESGIDTTTPVGRYRSGVSPYGIYDLAGNVWEWCATGAGPGRHVLRGSAFTSPFASAAAYEVNDASETMSDDDTGFRCVVSYDALVAVEPDGAARTEATIEDGLLPLLDQLGRAALTEAQWREATAQLERFRTGDTEGHEALAAVRRLLSPADAAPGSSADRGTPPRPTTSQRTGASAEVRDLITVIRRSVVPPQ